MKKFLKEVRGVAVVIVVALAFRSYVVTHAQIPSGSMIPTIDIGDHLIVSRIPTYYRTPERGEIITFKRGRKTLIKRVMAVSGDEINLIGGYVYINGEIIDESKYLNQLGVTYEFPNQVQFPYVVPEGHYFVMGDNRNGSEDSRFFGAIEKKDIRAIGALKIYPFNSIDMLD